MESINNKKNTVDHEMEPNKLNIQLPPVKLMKGKIKILLIVLFSI